MSWMVVWGGVESQLPAGQGSLPPTVQPAPCQGLLPAALWAAGTPKLWGPPPSFLMAQAQSLTPVGLSAHPKQAEALQPTMAAAGSESAPGFCQRAPSPIEREARGL